MQILDDMNDCTGCSACFNVCPKAAIEMKSDVEGFKFPVIDADKCVNCGLCREVCPVVSARFENSAAPACYAAQGSDELRAASSSGGAFGILAESVLKEGGAVAGAVFREDWTVEHVVVDKMDELWRLRGSKYMQSDMGNCYRQVKTLLDKGTRVLFPARRAKWRGFALFLKKITVTFTVWTSFVTACRRRRCFWRVCGKISAAKRMLTFSLFAIKRTGGTGGIR